MSRNAAVQTPSSDSHNAIWQDAQPNIKFRTVRVSGCNGNLLHLFTVGGKEAAAKNCGIQAYTGWFVDDPDRTWTAYGGSLDELAARMAASLLEPPTLAVVAVAVQNGHRHCGGHRVAIKGTRRYARCSRCKVPYRKHEQRLQALIAHQWAAETQPSYRYVKDYLYQKTPRRAALNQLRGSHNGSQ